MAIDGKHHTHRQKLKAYYSNKLSVKVALFFLSSGTIDF